jgi:hypothetical protein
LAGLLLIGAGGYITSNGAFDIIGLGGSIALASIIIGVIISFVSFLGCFGAANEKGMLLKTYFAMLVILIILEISVGIAAYGQRDSVDSLIQTSWRQAATTNQNATLTQVQNLFNCCGYASVDDYPVPLDCAQRFSRSISCKDKIVESSKSSLNTIGGAGVAIGVIEIIGLLFSFVLFKRIAAKENAQSSLLNEAWRINRTKVQYGYIGLI